jgi:hypothetical protein
MGRDGIDWSDSEYEQLEGCCVSSGSITCQEATEWLHWGPLE